jgi:hypothetical protein
MQTPIKKKTNDAIIEYLQSEFPSGEVHNVYDEFGEELDHIDFEQSSLKFNILEDTQIYIVRFKLNFLNFMEKNQDIKKVLAEMQLGRFIRGGKGKQVLVNENGIMDYLSVRS